jgi:type VI secretion system protein ImpC
MTALRPTSKVDLTLTFGDPHTQGRPDPEVPFRMLVMGDFSGKEARQGRTEPRSPANRRPIRVDRDNIQDLPGVLKTTLRSPLLGDHAPPLTLRFAELDDFHPDRLIQKIEPLQKLSDLRHRLANQATFAQAADEIGAWRQPQEPPKTPSSATESLPHPAGAGNLLDQLLEEASGSASIRRPTEWELEF